MLRWTVFRLRSSDILQVVLYTLEILLSIHQKIINGHNRSNVMQTRSNESCRMWISFKLFCYLITHISSYTMFWMDATSVILDYNGRNCHDEINVDFSWNEMLQMLFLFIPDHKSNKHLHPGVIYSLNRSI